MAPSCALTLRVEGQAEIAVRAVFDDDEWRWLNSFVQYAEELAATPVVQDGFSTSLKMKFTKENGLSIEAKAPPMDSVRLFLHKLRPLILQDERTSYYRISAILDRRFEEDTIRTLLRGHRRRFSSVRAQGLFTIHVSSTSPEAGGLPPTILNSDETLMKWLNAHEYHRDEDKQKELEELHRAFPADALRTIFVSLLIDKAQAIFDLADFARCVLGKQKEHSIRVPVTKKG
jgi:hypothetical protein